MLLDTLVASLSVNLLSGKGINTAGEGVIRAGYGRPLSFALQNNKADF